MTVDRVLHIPQCVWVWWIILHWITIQIIVWNMLWWGKKCVLINLIRMWNLKKNISLMINPCLYSISKLANQSFSWLSQRSHNLPYVICHKYYSFLCFPGGPGGLWKAEQLDGVLNVLCGAWLSNRSSSGRYVEFGWTPWLDHASDKHQ